MLKERLKEFRKHGMPMTKVAKEVNLSPQSIYMWLRDELKLSEATEHRIDEYLRQFGF